MALENRYKPHLNMLAFKQLARAQEKPAIKLASGGDENLSSQPVLVFTDAYANMHEKVIADTRKQAIEYTGLTGDGNIVDDSDFISADMYLGNPVEVI